MVYNTIIHPSVTLPSNIPHRERHILTDFNPFIYVESGELVISSGTKRSMRNGTRKMFMPASLNVWMVVVLGQA